MIFSCQSLRRHVSIFTGGCGCIRLLAYYELEDSRKIGGFTFIGGGGITAGSDVIKNNSTICTNTKEKINLPEKLLFSFRILMIYKKVFRFRFYYCFCIPCNHCSNGHCIAVRRTQPIGKAKFPSTTHIQLILNIV